ncbi:MAG: hypothetical protein PSY14_00785 [bacterium]|nr:hypothetical protein [bacterium]
MFKFITLYLSEVEPIGRKQFFRAIFIISLCSYFLKKISGNVPAAQLLVYLGSLPFIFVFVYARVLDIEKAQRKNSRLVQLWLGIVGVLAVANYYLTFYPIDTNYKLHLLWLLPPAAGIIGLHIYLLFKRGDKAISAEREEQAGIFKSEQNRSNDDQD